MLGGAAFVLAGVLASTYHVGDASSHYRGEIKMMKPQAAELSATPDAGLSKLLDAVDPLHGRKLSWLTNDACDTTELCGDGYAQTCDMCSDTTWGVDACEEELCGVGNLTDICDIALCGAEPLADQCEIELCGVSDCDAALCANPTPPSPPPPPPAVVLASPSPPVAAPLAASPTVAELANETSAQTVDGVTYTVIFELVVAGSVETFDKIGFKSKLAAVLQVEVSLLTIEVSAASVKIVATVKTNNPSVSSALVAKVGSYRADIAKLSADLGVTVESLSAAVVTVSGGKAQDLSWVAGVVILALIAILGCGYIGYLKKKGVPSDEVVAKPVGALSHDMSITSATTSDVVVGGRSANDGDEPVEPYGGGSSKEEKI